LSSHATNKLLDTQNNTLSIVPEYSDGDQWSDTFADIEVEHWCFGSMQVEWFEGCGRCKELILIVTIPTLEQLDIDS